MLFMLIIPVYCDNMYYTDYSKNLRFSWEYLKENNPYTIEQDDFYVKFAFGQDLEETCQGEKASVIQFWKDNSNCRVLGKHGNRSVRHFQVFKNSAVEVVYHGGILCRDKVWGDVLRKTEFRFFCSEDEGDFTLYIGSHNCRSLIEKHSKAGCSEKFSDSLFVKGLLYL